MLPVPIFLALYSLLPHKELRFVFYVTPWLNMDAAAAVARAQRRIAKSWPQNFIFVAAVLGLVINSFSLLFYGAASMHNYPGGNAFLEMHRRFATQPAHCDERAPVLIRIDNLAAQSGVTRFGQLKESFCDHWFYIKETHPVGHLPSTITEM